MFSSLDPAAKKALSLSKDAVFRLLVLMMILLGWLASMGAAGLAVFESVYYQWQLNQKSHVSIYLMPDSTPVDIQTLEEALLTQTGVEQIEPLGQEQVRQLVAPYIGDRTSLPLPKILDVRVADTLNRPAFEKQVLSVFAQAEIEDARKILRRVAHGVRFVQGGVFAVAGVAFLVLALLVSFTVRSGLRAQQHALNILQYIGATRGFVVKLVMQQVWWRAFLGGGIAAAACCVSLVFLQVLIPSLQTYLTLQAWLAALVVPVLLMGVVMAAAYGGVKHTLKRYHP